MTSQLSRSDSGSDEQVIVIGGGPGGLAFALALHQVGIPCRVVEAVAEIKPLGVGINLLPHATKVLKQLGVLDAAVKKSVTTQEVRFYTRNGQLVGAMPCGVNAGYDEPQLSIHRADLHDVLLEAARTRLGNDAIALGQRCTGVTQHGDSVEVHLEGPDKTPLPSIRGRVAVACDGVNSVVRKAMHPVEAVPRYEGTINYRGVTRWKPFLTGGSMIYLGTHETGKLVIYPLRNDIDAEGRQLVNWVIEITRDDPRLVRDWNRPGKVEQFISSFEHCNYDWLDIPAFLRAADVIYEWPMVDQEPLPFWTQGRVTLLGDAAHPMMPRGSNGAAQAIIDAVVLAKLLASCGSDVEGALKAYEAERLPTTRNIVLANRQISPDGILRVVEERTGGKSFASITDVLSKEEFDQWQQRYRKVAGFAKDDLQQRMGA